MRKKSVLLLVIGFGIVLLFAACGEKSQESVIKKLEENIDDMNGYKTTAEMTMNTGKEAHSFQIDVWHKKKDFYRVSLENKEDKKGNQVILKNEDGVFVLTPALDKSFKFQTDWPQNSSQPYLYQSLVSDVLSDEDAEFEVTDDEYIFKTKTNYQSNNNLPYQEIHFDKKTYTPKKVAVLDKDNKALVNVTFSEFNTKPSFEKGDFAKDNITSGSLADAPVSGNEQDTSFSVLTPMYLAGAELEEQKEVELDDGKRVILTFTGEKSYTLVEEKRDTMKTTAISKEMSGDIVNLGHSVGALSENSVEWSNNGVDFHLASDELTHEEMIEVAKSVQGKEVK
ncbi:MAG TPA: outer membrane lipoprotein carrier protein LolA [Bacillota bacterium]|nr:outer membrane lipoprotein carrier protein LolA [Bacillota bacterium]